MGLFRDPVKRESLVVGSESVIRDRDALMNRCHRVGHLAGRVTLSKLTLAKHRGGRHQKPFILLASGLKIRIHEDEHQHGRLTGVGT